jgi:hypothetical protein
MWFCAAGRRPKEDGKETHLVDHVGEDALDLVCIDVDAAVPEAGAEER